MEERIRSQVINSSGHVRHAQKRGAGMVEQVFKNGENVEHAQETQQEAADVHGAPASRHRRNMEAAFVAAFVGEHTVSVVVPALNEEENLPYVLPLIPVWAHEVILVDGHSTDGTVEVARRLRPDIRIVTQEGRGKGAALRSGFETATGDIIVMLDADGSMDPVEIMAFVGTLLAGADFVKGSRFVQGGGTTDMPLYRQIGNMGFVFLTNALFQTRFTDITYGYNAVWRRHKHALALEIDDWSHEIISNIRAARSKLRVVEIASFEHKRLNGEAKLKTFSAGWQILMAILKERFRRHVSHVAQKPIKLGSAQKIVSDLSHLARTEASTRIISGRELEEAR
jgi:glycosyltransferase involved in cell wall biosynthesis